MGVRDRHWSGHPLTVCKEITGQECREHQSVGVGNVTGQGCRSGASEYGSGHGHRSGVSIGSIRAWEWALSPVRGVGSIRVWEWALSPPVRGVDREHQSVGVGIVTGQGCREHQSVGVGTDGVRLVRARLLWAP